MNHLLNKDPAKRPSINNLLKYKIIKKHVYLILQNDVYKHDFSNTLAQGLDVFIKVKQGKKENGTRYDSNLILKEIIKDFKPTNGLS